MQIIEQTSADFLYEAFYPHKCLFRRQLISFGQIDIRHYLKFAMLCASFFKSKRCKLKLFL